MRRRDRLKASFVITIAGSVAQSAGCGGTTAEESGGTSSGGTSSTGGNTAMGGSGGISNPPLVTGGGPPATGGFTVSAGGTFNPPAITECPDMARFYEAMSCPAAGKCTMSLSCASGGRVFTADCDPARGYTVSQACELPYDHCYNAARPYEGADCVAGSWQLLGVGGNPPAPCPNEAPAVGKACRPGAFGGDREHCGYRCPDGTGWTVLSCAAADAPDAGGVVPYVWQSDGACGDGGI